MTNQEAIETISMLEEFFFEKSMDPEELGDESRDELRAISGAMKSALLRFRVVSGLTLSGDVTGIRLLRAARAD